MLLRWSKQVIAFPWTVVLRKWALWWPHGGPLAAKACMP